jgi:formiminotetrahydrofolate cyclodeaminase
MADEPLARLPIAEFLDRLASAAPTPGGGSVAALTGALAAALGRMVAAFTVGKPKFAPVEPQVRGLAQRLARADELLRRLIDEDAAAYGELSAAFKLDKSDPRRADHIAAAARLAASVPLETAAVSARVLADLDELRKVANPLLRADMEAAGHLARAALHAAAANVRANLPLMQADEARHVEQELRGLLPAPVTP